MYTIIYTLDIHSIYIKYTYTLDIYFFKMVASVPPAHIQPEGGGVPADLGSDPAARHRASAVHVEFIST